MNAKIKDDIENIKNKIVPILLKYGTMHAGIFGSFVRGDSNPSSDLDLLVEIPPELDLMEFVHIKGELEEAVKRDVDLIEYSSIKPDLRESILNEEVALI